MSEFKARLRMPPKRRMWLGCVVSEIVPCVSTVTGTPYVKVRFANCPHVYTLSQYMADQYRLAMQERGLSGPVLAVGDVVHVDVRWRQAPFGWYAQADVDFASLLEDRARIQQLIREGRA